MILSVPFASLSDYIKCFDCLGHKSPHAKILAHLSARVRFHIELPPAIDFLWSYMLCPSQLSMELSFNLVCYDLLVYGSAAKTKLQKKLNVHRDEF